MSTLYDIITSIVVGGILLAILIGFNGNMTQEAVAQTIKMMTQSNCTNVTQILDWDFRKMGYSLSSLDSSIITADTSRIKFRGAFNGTGATSPGDTLTWFLDNAPSGNANKNTHILYRTLNAQKSLAMNMGITRLRFSYFDLNGQPLSCPVSRPSQIKSLRIALTVESTVPYRVTTETYVKLNPGVYWERTFKPRNLR